MTDKRTQQPDTRHHRVTLLYDVPVNERDFEGWEMAYRDIDARPVSSEEGYSPVLEDGFDIRDIAPERARQVLSIFKDAFSR